MLYWCASLSGIFERAIQQEALGSNHEGRTAIVHHLELETPTWMHIYMSKCTYTALKQQSGCSGKADTGIKVVSLRVWGRAQKFIVPLNYSLLTFKALSQTPERNAQRSPRKVQSYHHRFATHSLYQSKDVSYHAPAALGSSRNTRNKQILNLLHIKSISLQSPHETNKNKPPWTILQVTNPKVNHEFSRF